ncbi:MAG: hypothetical protein QXT19_03130 [Candidatus Woesearchaeota archaeon]
MPKKKAVTIFDKPKEEDAEEISEEPEGFRELEEHPENPEEFRQKMDVGGAEIDVYTEEGREELMEDDEVAEWEEGFAEGEREPEKAHCAGCGKVLSQDESKIVEREIDHIIYNFCSDKCAKAGLQHAKKK